MRTGVIAAGVVIAALLVTGCSGTDSPPAAAPGSSSPSGLIPTGQGSPSAGSPSAGSPSAGSPSAGSPSAGSPSETAAASAGPSSSEAAPQPSDAITPECPDEAQASIRLAEGQTATSSDTVNARAGDGIFLYVDTDAEMPYEIAGTGIKGTLAAGQQGLCFAIGKPGTYAFTYDSLILLELVIS